MMLVPWLLLALAQAAPEAARTVPIAGTVSDADGRPVAGAEVMLTEGPPPPSETVRWSLPVPRPPEVLRRARADAEGRFQLELPPRGEPVAWLRRPFVLWAAGPGATWALRLIPDAWPPDGPPVHLRLAQSEPMALRVLDPEARPVAGARLRPVRVRGVTMPAELADRLAAETDAAGGARLAVAADDLELIRVAAEPFGLQQLRPPRPNAEGIRTLRLAPVGRVAGRLTAADPQAVRGVTVRLRSFVDPSADLTGVGGVAEVSTDDDGRFTVPALAAGMLAVALDLHWDLPFRGRFTAQPPVQPGETTEVEIPLQRATLLTGVVREQGSGRPLPGVVVCLGLDLNTPPVRTDAEGRYSAYYALPNVSIDLIELPKGYYWLGLGIPTQSIPPGAEEFMLPPRELAHGVTVRGRVVDAEGRPAPGAEVSGYWPRPERLAIPVMAVADRTGAFTITGVDPRVEVRLSARLGDATTAAPAPAWPEKEPVTLRISPEHAIALEGRVVGPESQPLAGASVRIAARKRGAEDFEVELTHFITFDDEGRQRLRTDADGRFRTPRRLRPDLEYRAEVEADGYALAYTEWLLPAKAKTFPDIVLSPIAPTRTVEGRIADAQGQPIAGAIVFQSGDGPLRTRTTTDAAGRFHLPGVFREPAYLFVQGDGLRFEGHRIDAGDGPVVVPVQRTDDPPGPPLRTLPPVLARDEEKALARRLIEGEMGPLTAKEVTREMFALMRIVARIDPARALELADQGALPGPSYNDSLRLEVALGLLGESPDEAAAIAETAKTPWRRSYFYCLVSDATPKADRARKLEWLDKALLHARAEPSPAERLEALGWVGYRLIDLGETERGTQVLREGQRLAESLPKFDADNRKSHAAHMRVRGWFAAKLARIDTKAAFELAEGFSAPYDDWYIGGVALGLSERDPEGAERALRMMHHGGRRDLITERVAGRMALKDRARARRLAETLTDPKDRALALGMMADHLADADPKAAAALIDEAFDLLLTLAEQGRDKALTFTDSTCSVAAGMLPTAERVDPALLRRCFWKTMALRPSRPAGGDPDGRYEDLIARLALSLARYDRAVGRQVLEPAARQVRSLTDASRSFRGQTLFAAATVIDPTWAVALADALPDDTPGADLRPKALARRTIAEVLAHGGRERWDYLEQSILFVRRDNKDDER
ncbi:MAG: carboxypeptidase regulatory-like domain-containing protein [Isosphaeraceae bacterium]|nr:carboxypeptidase regulatory-like domain-containing protein [Isosphaeraceae bacterium]